MIVYPDIETMPFVEDAVVTIGTFDVVHLAHRAVLEEVVQSAKSIKGKAVVITFFPHPREVTDPDSEVRLLSTKTEKNSLLGKSGVNIIVYINFNSTFAKTRYFDFIKLLASKMNIRKMVVGYDHDFGQNKEGTVHNLRKISPLYNFEVVEVPKQTADGMDVSSSIIRDAIHAGNILLANKLLGYDYEMSIVMSHCTEDYICFNVKLKKVIPPEGIYAVNIQDKTTIMEIGRQIRVYDKDSEIRGTKKRVLRIQFLNRII